MREIKFRAWNNYSEEMIFSDIKGWSMFGDCVMDYTDVYEIMQYTGLKDKNGVDIYEGDILKCLHPKYLYQENPEYDEHLEVVRWDDKEARFTDGHSNFGAGGEIVGNIYENPELLK